MVQDLKHITSQLKSFPSMPGAAVKLLALMDDPEINVTRIEKILHQDAGLTANLLKLANSAYFGIPSKVGSVRQAVLLLGLKRLIQMVIASCVSAIMDKPVPGYDLAPGELWRHSLAVTVAAEGLVKELKVDAAEEIFTAALLHDVGKLVLGEFVADDFSKIENVLSPEIAFQTAEDMVLGTNHADIGASILNQWSLPPGIVNAVRWHHDPDACESTDLLPDLVHLAADLGDLAQELRKPDQPPLAAEPGPGTSYDEWDFRLAAYRAGASPSRLAEEMMDFAESRQFADYMVPGFEHGIGLAGDEWRIGLNQGPIPYWTDPDHQYQAGELIICAMQYACPDEDVGFRYENPILISADGCEPLSKYPLGVEVIT